MKLALPCLLIFSLTTASAYAGECEDNFKKSGNPLKGTNYNSSVTVANLTVKDALSQMRGLVIADKMDVINEDIAAGNMLVEQRRSTFARPVPVIIAVSREGTSAIIDVTVKTESGVFAKQADLQASICKMLVQVKGGKEGKQAATQGSKAQNNTNTTSQDVFAFSMDIANEAHKNAIAVNARHKGRSYSLKGKIEAIQEDGEEYNVSFEIPDIHERALTPFPGTANFKVDVACLFNPNQLSWVLTMRQGQRVRFNGTFYRYDHSRKVVWLQNCTQVK